MKLTLRQRLIKWFSSRPNEVISGGEMEKIVGENTAYKASNVSRRLRELVEDGVLVATYERGFVSYQWNLKQVTLINKVFKVNLKPLLIEDEMAKVQLTLV